MERHGTPAERQTPSNYGQYDTGVPRSAECASDGFKCNNLRNTRNNEKDNTNPSFSATRRRL
jgi:hypothetical protein